MQKLPPNNRNITMKCLKNSNGDTLLRLAKEKKLILKNTPFNHIKYVLHQTTWTAKNRPYEYHHHDGTICQNPIKNQIH